MRHGSLIFALAFALAGCPGGDGGIGDPCSGHGDCGGQFQCISNVCVPRCERAPDCGDGYRCDEAGLCHAATGQTGDTCRSEVDCAAGLSCQIEGTEIDDGFLLASCGGENSGRPAGALCESHGECRNGTCDLGHCLDLCADDRDCSIGTQCTEIPRIVTLIVDNTQTEVHARYRGCLQAHGSVKWTLPIHSPSEDVHLPVPASARSVSMMFTIDDPNQKVGATQLLAPHSGEDLLLADDYYDNPFVRHRPEFGESVLAMPISPAPAAQLRSGVYVMRVKSQRPTICTPPQQPPCYIQGTSTPTGQAVIKVDDAAILDLHFYFLNLDDHPCGDAFGNQLDASTAQTASYFEQFLGEIRNILGTAVYFDLGNVTYKDLRDHPDLDGLDADHAPALLSLGEHSTGINVFFVRTLSPIGLQAVGPNPGPAGLANTRRSGIVIGVDTLCYRTWRQLARLTAHEIGRYMGLYNNVGIDPAAVDPIADTDMSSSNLMFYSELGGTFLSEGQKQILRRSAVLR
ncbi:MAG TPA: hypothetical protein VIV11_18120 [Kofleriaceae bacterium]